jgi:hypothetical protein
VAGSEECLSSSAESGNSQIQSSKQALLDHAMNLQVRSQIMSQPIYAQLDEGRYGAAVAFILCSVSGGVVGFIIGLAAAWL